MFVIARRARHTINVWPAFVDALASVLLVLVFMLLIFVVGRYLLGVQLAGRDRALDELGRQVSALADTLALERASAEALRSRLQATLAELQARTQEAEAARAETGEVRADVALLNQQVAALRSQIEALNRALEFSEDQLAAGEVKITEQQAEIARLAERLNVALAKKAEELQRYRSEFFGRLRAVLGEHPSIRIVGDRFVFQSELLFPSGEAALTAEGERRLAQLAQTLKSVTQEIPRDIEWVLQVAGHTDVRPIKTAQFPSNWELSAARALSVVHFLADHGIPPRHLAAAGFGEHYPIDPGSGEAAYAKNRRIEIKLTQP